MQEATLYWTKVAAIGQVAGAIATAAAVIVSLCLAYHGRRPRLNLTVGHWLIIGGNTPELSVLMFKLVNAGDRPVHINGIGWKTGWTRWGPQFLCRQAAVQMTEVHQLGDVQPPFELRPGTDAALYAVMENVLAHCRERQSPFFTRDWPFSMGRKATRVRAYAYTADGHIITVRPEKRLLEQIAEAEIQGLACPAA